MAIGICMLFVGLASVSAQNHTKNCSLWFTGTNFGGTVVASGDTNSQPDEAHCCASCAVSAQCNVWVFCPRPKGCDNGFGTVYAANQCWLKHDVSGMMNGWIALHLIY